MARRRSAPRRAAFHAEELHLLGKLMRGIGSENIDSRLRQADFSADAKQTGAPWLGMKIADIGGLDRVLVVGSFLRKDHPLIANRLRQAAKRGQQINLIHATDDDLLLKLAHKIIVPPQELPAALAQVVKAVAEAKQQPCPPHWPRSKSARRRRTSQPALASGKNAGIFLGNLAEQHPQASQLRLLAQELAALLGAKFGFFGAAANSVGAYLAHAVPGAGGLNAAAMLAQARKAYLLLNAEPELDCNDSHAAMKAMAAAEFVVSLSAYKGYALDYANVLLPIAPFTETSGTFVNAEGRMQSFNGVVKPLGDARPAWKVLRVPVTCSASKGSTTTAVNRCATRSPCRARSRPSSTTSWTGSRCRFLPCPADCKELPRSPSISPTRSCAAPRRCNRRTMARPPRALDECGAARPARPRRRPGSDGQARYWRGRGERRAR